MTAKIGIFAPRENTQARRVLNELEKAGAHAVFFDTGLPPEEQVALDGTGARWNGVDLTELDSAYIHDFSFQSPVVPAPGGTRDWSVWQADYPAQQQKYSFLSSLFTRLGRHGVRMVNPVEASHGMFAKPHLLQHLSRERFSVPDILVTNSPRKAKAFCSEHETVIWRPQNDKAAWQLCRDKQRKAIVHTAAPPPILAQALSGPITRSWIFEGEPILTLRSAPPSAAVPERLEHLTRVDAAPFEDELTRLAATLDVPWFQILFVPEGNRVWLYDIDTDPIFDWLPNMFADALTSSLTACLARTPAMQTHEENSAQRPALFLRRMLRILFDFEHCKYSESK